MAYQSKKYKEESDYDKKVVIKALNEITKTFDSIGAKNGLDAATEFTFVWGILTSNLSLLEKACQAPEQLKRALLGGAGMGLTLDPGRQFAYLTVRRGRLIYDISYRGLIKIAVDEGLVKHVKPELVHSKDHFEYRGPHQRPVHECQNFFGDRGKIVGGYCVALLADDSLCIETMRESEFLQIAKLNTKSDAWKNDFSSGEMRKKTLVKRAQKWWYSSAAADEKDGHAPGQRLAAAINHLNTEGGEGIETQSAPESPEPQTPAEPVAESEVRAQAVEHIRKLVARAAEKGAWSAAEQYVSDRFDDREQLFGLQQIEAAKKAAAAALSSASPREELPPPAEIPD